MKASEAILDLLLDQNQGLSQKDITTHLAKKFHKVTIYRAIDQLITQKKVHKVLDAQGISRFMNCHECDDHHSETTTAHKHIHFECSNCGVLECLTAAKFSFEMPNGYKVAHFSFVVSGLCPNCHHPNQKS
ncbi:MAG: hypothetical protein MUE53_04200 [Chitinophagales bacterium]|jgi:Fur family ferric uptake transcriptional regulator|nr:hypothetical protein [Chitinophagales bacterium]